MSRRYAVALIATLGLAAGFITSAAAPALADWDGYRYRHHEWRERDHRPYWRPPIHVEPRHYYQERRYDCRWENQKSVWVDRHGERHWVWKQVKVCD